MRFSYLIVTFGDDISRDGIEQFCAENKLRYSAVSSILKRYAVEVPAFETKKFVDLFVNLAGEPNVLVEEARPIRRNPRPRKEKERR